MHLVISDEYLQMALGHLHWNVHQVLNSFLNLFFSIQSFVSLHMFSWRLMNMSELLGRSSKFAAIHTTPTSITTSPGSTPPSRSVSSISEYSRLWCLAQPQLWCYFFFLCPQKVTVEERVRSSGENRLDIQSILTISAVDLADTGNISCIGTNEAGVNSSTTYLLVVGKPQRWSLLPNL